VKRLVIYVTFSPHTIRLACNRLELTA